VTEKRALTLIFAVSFAWSLVFPIGLAVLGADKKLFALVFFGSLFAMVYATSSVVMHYGSSDQERRDR
jgi:hypothetical protein